MILIQRKTPADTTVMMLAEEMFSPVAPAPRQPRPARARGSGSPAGSQVEVMALASSRACLSHRGTEAPSRHGTCQ